MKLFKRILLTIVSVNSSIVVGHGYYSLFMNHQFSQVQYNVMFGLGCVSVGALILYTMIVNIRD